MPYNKVKINVAGTSYVVNTQDSEEQVLSLAKKLDDDMKTLRQLQLPHGRFYVP